MMPLINEDNRCIHAPYRPGVERIHRLKLVIPDVRQSCENGRNQ